MTAFWTEPDFDDHELVQVVRDRASGLTAIIAVHSSHLGPGAGGTRFWHYPNPKDGLRDALRLSRGMSYKNAMAGLPMGGGKAVILADEARTKTPELLAAFGDAVEALNGRYVTAEDVGISEADMVAVSQRTAHVSGLPVSGENAAGGDPDPSPPMASILVLSLPCGTSWARIASRAFTWRCRALAAWAAASLGCWQRMGQS